MDSIEKNTAGSFVQDNYHTLPVCETFAGGKCKEATVEAGIIDCDTKQMKVVFEVSMILEERFEDTALMLVHFLNEYTTVEVGIGVKVYYMERRKRKSSRARELLELVLNNNGDHITKAARTCPNIDLSKQKKFEADFGVNILVLKQLGEQDINDAIR